VLFDPETVTDHASFATPHAPATGIESVWVTGVLVFDGGAAPAAERERRCGDRG